MIFTAYDKISGEILFTIDGNRYDAEANSPYVEGYYSRSEYTIVGGKPTRRSEDEILSQEISSAWDQLRINRDAMLKESDWTQVPDAPVARLAWAEYRQALRDLPANTTDPRNPDWPALPA